jgi:hypothetical protein
VSRESGLSNPLAVDLESELNLVAARRAARGGSEPSRGQASLALGREKVMFEGESVHPREDREPEVR